MSLSPGVGGAVVICRFRRSQNPAFGPLMMKARTHRDRPRRESGWYIAAVSRDAREMMKARLIKSSVIDEQVIKKIAIPFSHGDAQRPTTNPFHGQHSSHSSRNDIQRHLSPPSLILDKDTAPTNKRSNENSTSWSIPEIV